MIQKYCKELEEQEDMGSLHWLYCWNMEEVINKYADKEILEYQKKIKQYVEETFYSETLMAINIMI